MRLQDKLFGFYGRLRRQDWWLLGIALGLVFLAAKWALNWQVFSGAVDFNSVTFVSPAPVLATSLALSAAYLWPMAALSAKRAHDLNWPAWPVIIALLLVEGLPYAPFDLTPAFSEGPHTGLEITLTAMVGILLIIWIAVLIFLGFIDGARGPNRFGLSPKLVPSPYDD